MMRNILIIDDDLVTRNMLASRLKKRNFSVDVLSGSIEDIEKSIKSAKYSIVLLGETLLESDVSLVILSIRSSFDVTELPILLLASSGGYLSASVKFLDIGVSDFIVKPVNIDVAVARINSHLQIVHLNNDSKAKSELDSLNKIITTYNHEINNPLSIAIGYIDILKQKGCDEKIVKGISDALKRVADIIKDIERVSEERMIREVDYATFTKRIDLNKKQTR